MSQVPSPTWANRTRATRIALCISGWAALAAGAFATVAIIVKPDLFALDELPGRFRPLVAAAVALPSLLCFIVASGFTSMIRLLSRERGLSLNTGSGDTPPFLASAAGVVSETKPTAAPAENEIAPALTTDDVPAGRTPKKPLWRSKKTLLAGGLLAVVAASAIWFFTSRDDGNASLIRKLPESVSAPDQVAILDETGEIAIWSTRTGRRVKSVTKPSSDTDAAHPDIHGLDLVNDGRQLTWIDDDDEQIVIWDEDLGIARRIPAAGASCATLAPDGESIAYQHEPSFGEGVITVLDWRAEETLYESADDFEVASLVTCPAWSPDGAQLAFFVSNDLEDWELRVIDVRRGDTQVMVLDGITPDGTLQLTDDGSVVFMSNGKLAVADVEDGEEIGSDSFIAEDGPLSVIAMRGKYFGAVDDQLAILEDDEWITIKSDPDANFTPSRLEPDAAEHALLAGSLDGKLWMFTASDKARLLAEGVVEYSW